MVQLAVYFPEYFSYNYIIRKSKVPTVTRFEVPFIKPMKYNWPPQEKANNL